MNYSSLMVHLDLGVSNEALLQLTAEMAGRFGAGVIGVTAYQPMQIMYGDGYVPGTALEEDRAEIERQGKEAEERFRTAMHNRVPTIRWSSTVGYMQLADCVADQARGADLLLVAPEPRDGSEAGRRLDVGDLMMRLGRPLIVVPRAIDALNLKRVVIGWKDTRETRRAVLDALPLLRSAGHVTIMQILENAEEMAATRRNLEEIVVWLAGHGVVADAIAEPLSGSASAQLETAAADRHAGLLVIGAYGHSRLREWALGGVTRDALQRPVRCSFMSH